MGFSDEDEDDEDDEDEDDEEEEEEEEEVDSLFEVSSFLERWRLGSGDPFLSRELDFDRFLFFPFS